jgi:hypothetical protein
VFWLKQHWLGWGRGRGRGAVLCVKNCNDPNSALERREMSHWL